MPTDLPESDGTFQWDSTTIIIVEAEAGGERGVGYSYADAVAASLIRDKFAELIVGRDAMAVSAAWIGADASGPQPRPSRARLHGDRGGRRGACGI